MKITSVKLSYEINKNEDNNDSNSMQNSGVLNDCNK